MKLKAPWPYFGGKSAVADEVWKRFGTPDTYVEPFCGTAAVLLGSPHWPRRHVLETINDASGWIVNAWRAIQNDPQAVAHYADAPVFEVDLHARHLWLLGQRNQLVERLEGDPDYYDAKIAGWWIWGASCWIGSGWCSGNGPWMTGTDADGYAIMVKRDTADDKQGVKRQMPHVTNAGQGVKRKMPHVGDAGQGVNRQMPEMGSGRCVAFIPTADYRTAAILQWMQHLADRLRNVRILSGDWKRCVTPAVTTRHGIAAIFLDPPYSHDERTTGLYSNDDDAVAAAARQWCLENGDNPNLRLALCGYDGEHNELDNAGWERFSWKTRGGYGSQSNKRGRENATREVIWFNRACVTPWVQPTIF